MPKTPRRQPSHPQPPIPEGQADGDATAPGSFLVEPAGLGFGDDSAFPSQPLEDDDFDDVLPSSSRRAVLVLTPQDLGPGSEGDGVWCAEMSLDPKALARSIERNLYSISGPISDPSDLRSLAQGCLVLVFCKDRFSKVVGPIVGDVPFACLDEWIEHVGLGRYLSLWTVVGKLYGLRADSLRNPARGMMEAAHELVCTLLDYDSSLSPGTDWLSRFLSPARPEPSPASIPARAFGPEAAESVAQPSEDVIPDEFERPAIDLEDELPERPSPTPPKEPAVCVAAAYASIRRQLDSLRADRPLSELSMRELRMLDALSRMLGTAARCLLEDGRSSSAIASSGHGRLDELFAAASGSEVLEALLLRRWAELRRP